MRNFLRWTSAALSAAVLTVGMVAASAAAAEASSAAPAAVQHADLAAVTCYGGAVSATLSPGGYTPTFTTTTRCADINLRINSGGGAWVAVCWVAHGYCQDHWTWVPQDGSFHVVASSVLDGTKFDFDTWAGNSGGARAASAAF